VAGRSAVVVGAGMSGLAAAGALARTGWTVTLLERGDRLRPGRERLNLQRESGVRTRLLLQNSVSGRHGFIDSSGREGRPAATDCLRVACRTRSLSRGRVREECHHQQPDSD